MYSSERIVQIISSCGGIFRIKFLKRLIHEDTFYKYIKANNIADVLQKTLRRESGYLLKLEDSIIKKYCNISPSKKRKVFTIKGSAELTKRIKKYNKEHQIQVKKDSEIYKRICDDLEEKKEFVRETRYEINSFTLYKSLGLISLFKDESVLPYYGESAQQLFEFYPANFGRGVFPSFSYEHQRKVIIILDAWKSLENILSTLHFFNDIESGIIFYVITIKDKDMLSNIIYKGKKFRGTKYEHFTGEFHVKYYPQLAEEFGVFFHKTKG